jgi:hypothetical protein
MDQRVKQESPLQKGSVKRCTIVALNKVRADLAADMLKWLYYGSITPSVIDYAKRLLKAGVKDRWIQAIANGNPDDLEGIREEAIETHAYDALLALGLQVQIKNQNEEVIS